MVRRGFRASDVFDDMRGVRVEKQKPAPVRDCRAGIHLPGSSPRRLDPDDVRAREAKRRQRAIAMPHF